MPAQIWSASDPPVLHQRRCLLVVAAPGYGKTSSLRRWLPAAETVWAEFTSVGELALPPVDGPPPRSGRRWIVLDDLPPLPPAEASGLLAWVAGLPDAVAVAIASRLPLRAPLARWHGRGLLSQVHPGDLALTVEQVGAVLRDDYDLRDPSLATAVHQATSGWPALVQLAAETLAREQRSTTSHLDALAERLAEPSTAVSAYLCDEVLPALPSETLRPLLDLAAFEPLSVDLGRAVGVRDASAVIELLTRVGLLAPAQSTSLRADHQAQPDGQRLVPVLAAVLRQRARPRAKARARLAAEWYAQHGPPIAAARALHEAGDDAACRDVLTDRGEEILAAGGAVDYIRLVGSLPSTLRTARTELLRGDALRAIGDVSAALAVFTELATRSELVDPAGGWDPGLAWRIGMVHYQRADPRTALGCFGHAAKGAGHPRDEVQLLAWTATAYWMLGDVAVASEHARQALGRASELGDDRALAAAHIVVAMCLKLTGDAAGVDENYASALRCARRAGDLAQVIRILVNQSSDHLARARYPEALAVAGTAARTAESAGPAGMLIVALCNEAEALDRVGRLDEAIERYTRVVAMCQRMGSRRTAVALVGLGEVHRRRAWREQARAAYEEGLRVARESGEMQALVPGLAGLARVIAPDDPGHAAALAEEAAGSAQGSWVVAALGAQGWVALAAGEPARAAELADLAVREARYRREPRWLAEALELRAAAEADPRTARAALVEAHTIWHQAGAVLDADRLLVTIANLPGAGTAERLSGMLARQRQTAVGVQPAAATLPLLIGPGGPSRVQVLVLGRFEVRVGDRPVPPTAWQSRKARDLLRILVARRARVVPREELAEVLWPEDDPARTGHRLSVLLSILRGVLDPDRTAPNDQLVLADKSGIALDPTWVRIDVEDFLADVGHGCRLYEQGGLAEAESVLAAATRSYLGDPFDDEPYADWTAALREQARAAYLRATRTLARLARHDGDTDRVVGHLLAILERDPYDEEAHRAMVGTLVAAGRHGEGRRAHARYRDAMRAIGAPAPDDSLLAAT